MLTQRVLSRATSAALIVLLGIVCAYWFWIFLAPPASLPAPVLPDAAMRPDEAVRRAHLFGAMAAAPAAEPARTDLVLRGLYATRSGGMAVIALDPRRTVTVRAGDEIAPGLVLERVLPTHVIIRRDGTSQRLELPQGKPVDAPPAGPGAAKKAR